MTQLTLIARLRKVEDALEVADHNPKCAVRDRDAFDDREPCSCGRDAALADLRELIKEGEGQVWQPIETAPKDGTQILALTQGGDIYAVSYDDIFSAPWRLINEFGFNGHVMAKWMPLPPPPALGEPK